jgi:hypothetical protein
MQWDVCNCLESGWCWLVQLHRDVAAPEGVSAFWVVLECDGIASHSAHSPDSALRVTEILKIILYDVRNPKMKSDSISAAGFASHETYNSVRLPLSPRLEDSVDMMKARNLLVLFYICFRGHKLYYNEHFYWYSVVMLSSSSSNVVSRFVSTPVVNTSPVHEEITIDKHGVRW